jgi:hypothetical protein
VAAGLRELGYAIPDGDRIPIEVPLACPEFRALLRNTRMSSQSAARSGEELPAAAIALMRRVEASLR